MNKPGIKDFIIMGLTVLSLILIFKAFIYKDKAQVYNFPLYIKNPEVFKPDKPMDEIDNPKLVTIWKNDTVKNVIIVNDTIRNKVLVNDTVKNVITEYDYGFLSNHTNADKLLQMDLSYSKLSMTLQNKDNEVYTYLNELDLKNYKYRYLPYYGLTKDRDLFGKQHFEDYITINHDFFDKSSSLLNNLQYKTGSFIIEGRLGLNYFHNTNRVKLKGEIGMGYKIY